MIDENISNSSNGISYSKINDTPKNIYITEQISRILPRTNNSIWVNDNLISNCYSCKVDFTFYRRKHHCRGCGRIFCYYCSSKNISSDICNKTKLIDKYKFISTENGKYKDNRVCDKCYEIFTRLKQIRKCITIIQLLPLDLVYIYKYTLVSKIWNETIIIYLSMFRDIQYTLPIQEINSIQKKMLYNNLDNIVGHNKLMYNYIKSNIWCNEDIDIILNKFKLQKNNLECKDLLCNSKCSKSLTHSNILDILNSNRNKKDKKICYKEFKFNRRLFVMLYNIFSKLYKIR